MRRRRFLCQVLCPYLCKWTSAYPWMGLFSIPGLVSKPLQVGQWINEFNVILIWSLQNPRLCSPCVQQILGTRCGIHDSLLLDLSQTLQGAVSRIRCNCCDFCQKKKGKVFSRLFGMELTQQVGGTSTEDGMVLVNLVLMFLCHSRLLEMLGNFSKDYFFAVLQMFPAQETCDMTTDFQETITVLPLGLTSALSLVVSWVEVFWGRIAHVALSGKIIVLFP